MVYVRDIEVGKKYLVNGVSKTLTKKEEAGRGGSGFQEPYFKLVFDDDDDTAVLKDWDYNYNMTAYYVKGGKRKSRRNRKSQKSRKGKSRKGKSRKNRRKSNRRRR